MRADAYVLHFLDRCLGSVHAARRRAVSFGVDALLAGGRLSLTALARGAPGPALVKHRIKRIDRLFGNEALHEDLAAYYAALAAFVLQQDSRPMILVDWSPVGVGSLHYALVASVPVSGRALSIYAEVYDYRKNGNRKIERRFLARLARLLPAGAKPIIVTDAGFRTPWFDAVVEQGWDFVGRVRHRAKVRPLEGGTWVPAKRLWAQARRRPHDLGIFTLTQSAPRDRRLVIVDKRKPRGNRRSDLTKRGKRSQSIQAQRGRKSAHEPWLLATSLTTSAEAVVGCYARRMETEETFRDLKSHRFGWSFEDARSRSSSRLAVMMLLAAVAAVITMLIGAAAEAVGLARQYQANTIRHRRVLSLIFLGKEVIRSRAAELLEFGFPPALFLPSSPGPT